MQKIYCVEDDNNIRELVCYALQSSGFKTFGFENATTFFDALKSDIPDMILLDIMLPDKDGMQILREMKLTNLWNNIPTIMLTAKSSEIDKVRGLDFGADDYITKPFSVLELISRVKAVLRRSDKKEKKLCCNNIEIDLQSRNVAVKGKNVILTYKEYELLCYLIKNKNIVLSRDRLLSDVWGYDFEGESRTVDVHIRTLRQKLGEDSVIIETVRNVGYKVGTSDV